MKENHNKHTEDNLEHLAKEGFDAFAQKHSFSEVEISLKKKFLEQHPKTQSYSNTKIRWIVFGIAAAVALLIVAIFLRPPSHERLYAQYFSPMRDNYSQLERSVGDQEDVLFRKAMVHYNDAEYAAAVDILNQVPTTAMTDLYKAASYLALGEATKASGILERLNNPDTKDVQDWYLALAYLKDKNTKKAIFILQQIAKDTTHYKQKQALELLGKLE